LGAARFVRRVQTFDLANGQPELLCSKTLRGAALCNAPHECETF
jgi:hypothetical protein